MKKLIVLMMMITLSLSLVACGGDKNPTAPTPDTTPSSSDADTSKPDDLIANEANGLSFGLPADIKYVQTDEDNGAMIYANDERTAVVTVGVKTETTLTNADVTEDALLEALSAGGGLSDATLDNSATVEQSGGIAVVGFGKGTMSNGTVMNSAVQFFFPADGGSFIVISYLYVVDAGSSMDANIERVMATVTTVE